QVLLLGYLLLYTSSALNQGVETLQVYAYTEMSALQIDLLILAAVLVFALYSIKGMAKTISIFLPLILVVIAAILLLSVEQYDVNLLNPVFGHGGKLIANRSVMLTSKFNAILMLAVFGGSFPSKRMYGRSAFWGILLSTVFFTAAALCYCMAIPYSSMEDIQVGIIGLAQGNWGGRFLQRLESSYIAVDVMAILLLIGYSFLALKKIYCHMFGITKDHSRAVLIPLAGLVLCVTRTVGNNVHFKTAARYLARRYSGMFSFALIVLTLIISYIRRQGRPKLPKAARIASIIVSICMVAGLFGGCNYKEPDSEIFPIVMGYDKGEKEKYRITMKFMTESKSPEGKDAKDEKDPQSGQTPDDIMVFECPSFSEGLHLVNSLMPREVSLLHIKMLVVSEELAKEGVAQIVDPLIRYNEIKPTLLFVVCKDSAYDFVSSKNASLTAPAQSDIDLMGEATKRSTSYLNSTLSQFLYSYKSTYGDAMAIYGNLNQAEFEGAGSKEEAEKETPPDKLARAPSAFADGYLAGELPVIGNRELELAGMTVFVRDKLAGILNTRECQTLAFLMNTVEESLVAFPDMLDPEQYYVVLSMRQVQPVEVHTHIGEDNIAHITIRVSVNGLVGLSQNPDANYMADPDLRTRLNDYCAEIMRQRSEALLDKLQTEYKADVMHLGRKVARNFLTIRQWEEYNWLEQYPNADIRVEYQILL
ncbi:GerAB/ArcD/ProY family transporter, partial [Ruminococcaceae bacterium OttesenSCG-928-L11]|nr:GerAB/ArcD/ProY family transporter [Ruminococcaceae bacterium OttesenSCG-928-L11]